MAKRRVVWHIIVNEKNTTNMRCGKTRGVLEKYNYEGIISPHFYINYILRDPNRFLGTAKVCLKCKNKISPLDILVHTDL